MHRVERQVEADSEEPEMPESEPAVEQAAGGFRIPVVETGEDCEEHSAYQCVVKVCNDEVRVGELPVKRCDSQHDARQTRNQKLKEKTQTEDHRQVKSNLAAVHRAQPVENLDARRH